MRRRVSLGAKLARFTSWMPAERLMWPRSLPAARLGVLALRILPVAVKIELVDEQVQRSGVWSLSRIPSNAKTRSRSSST